MLYASCLIAVNPIFRFLRRNWLCHICCWCHFKSLVMVTPRYFTDVTLDSVWPCSLYSAWNDFLLLVTVRTSLCVLICEPGNITNSLWTDVVYFDFGATLSWTEFVMGRNVHFPCSISRHYETSATFGGSNSNALRGTRGHIGHQMNRCVLFWRRYISLIINDLYLNWCNKKQSGFCINHTRLDATVTL